MEAETTNIVQPENNEHSSEEVKPVSESESIIIEEDDKLFLQNISICSMCKENVNNKSSKFLSCLHTFCTSCIEKFDVLEGNQVKCSTCGHQTNLTELIENLFDIKPSESNETAKNPPSINEDEEKEKKKCMCCEDDVDATFYCVECSECLCDQCTQAHKRVKLTKDHTLEPQKTSEENANKEKTKEPKSLFMCQLHVAEELKLYCCTCGVMTCRDCQLLEHKDHKYQFINEAAGPHREILSNFLEKVKEKQKYIENAKKLIEKRNDDISQKEELVINEMKVFSSNLIAQIHQQSIQLAADLQLIQEAKRAQLSKKELEISQLCGSLETSIGFCEHLLSSSDDKRLLYFFHLVISRLKTVLMTRCEVPNPNHVIDIRFKPNVSISSSLEKLGHLIVDGESFQKTDSSNPLQQQHSQKNKSSLYNLMNQPLPTNQSHLNSIMSMLPDGKFSHWLKRQSDQRRTTNIQQQQQHIQIQQQQQQIQHQQQIQQQQQQLHLQQLQQQQQMQKMISLLPPEEAVAHLPNQSGTITSSNSQKRRTYFQPHSHLPHLPQHPPSHLAHISQHSPHQQLQQLHMQQKQQQQQQQQMQQQLIMQQQYPGNFQVPNFHSPSHIIHHHQQQQQQHLINLNLLQHERAKKQHKQQQHKPIVIEPTNVEMNASPNSFHELVKCTEDPNQNVKKEIHFSNHSVGGRRSSSGKSAVSRSPTPRIESTTSVDLHNNDASSYDCLLDTFEDFIASTENNHMFDDADKSFLRSSDRLKKRKRHGNDLDSQFELDYAKKNPSPQLVYDGFPASGKLSLDPSEDYCAVCNNGESFAYLKHSLSASQYSTPWKCPFGELLCCDGCPKVFHMQCHVSQLSSAPSDKWFCGLCTSDEDLKLSADENTMEDNNSRHHIFGLSSEEEKVCKRLLLELYCDFSSTPFQTPISKNMYKYHKLIAHPIDMSQIRSKLGRHHFDHYKSPSLFVQDVLLLFANCAAFNSAESEVVKAGEGLKSKFMQRCGVLIPQLDLQELIKTSSLLNNITKPNVPKPTNDTSQENCVNSTAKSNNCTNNENAKDKDRPLNGNMNIDEESTDDNFVIDFEKSINQEKDKEGSGDETEEHEIDNTDGIVNMDNKTEDKSKEPNDNTDSHKTQNGEEKVLKKFCIKSFEWPTNKFDEDRETYISTKSDSDAVNLKRKFKSRKSRSQCSEERDSDGKDGAASL